MTRDKSWPFQAAEGVCTLQSKPHVVAFVIAISAVHGINTKKTLEINTGSLFGYLVCGQRENNFADECVLRFLYHCNKQEEYCLLDKMFGSFVKLCNWGSCDDEPWREKTTAVYSGGTFLAPQLRPTVNSQEYKDKHISAFHNKSTAHYILFVCITHGINTKEIKSLEKWLTLPI